MLRNIIFSLLCGSLSSSVFASPIVSCKTSLKETLHKGHPYSFKINKDETNDKYKGKLHFRKLPGHTPSDYVGNRRYLDNNMNCLMTASHAYCSSHFYDGSYLVYYSKKDSSAEVYRLMKKHEMKPHASRLSEEYIAKFGATEEMKNWGLVAVLLTSIDC